MFPDRPISPRLSDKRLEKSHIEIQAQQQKKTAYIPPHLRARGEGPSDIMKKEHNAEASGTVSLIYLFYFILFIYLFIFFV